MLFRSIDLETPFDRMHEQLGLGKNRELWGGIILIVLDSLFLLDNFEVLRLYQIAKLWPALLILGGVLMVRRFQEGKQE